MTHAPSTRPQAQATPPADDADRPLVYVNGQIVPKSRAMVSVFDHGLLYGDGVFEGIRVYNRRVFKLRTHLRRLYESARAIRLDMAQPPDASEEVVAPLYFGCHWLS